MKSFKKKSLILSIKLILAAAVFWFLITTAQIKMELFSNMFHKPFLFSSVISLFLLMVVIGSWRWYQLNSAQGINFSFKKTLLPTYLGVAFNNLLPGAVGGDFVRMHYLFNRIPEKKSTAVLSIFFDRVLGFLGIFVVLIFTAIFQLHFITQQSTFSFILLLGMSFCIASLFLLVGFISWAQKRGLDNWLAQRFPNKNWTQPIISFLNAAYIYRIPKLTILKCLLLSIAIQLLIAFSAFIIAEIMGLPTVSFSHYIIATSVTQIVNLIPVTPGGIGVGELAFANVLTLLNPGMDAGFATVFLAYRLISMLTYLPGAILYIPRFLFLKQTTRA